MTETEKTSDAVRAVMDLSSPLSTEPGHTAQVFAVASIDARIADLNVGEGAEAIGLMSGMKDVKPGEGQSWSDLLSSEMVYAAKGQHVIAIVRNMAAPAKRLKATAVLLPSDAGATKANGGSSQGRTTTPAAAQRSPLAPSEDVRFMVERGYGPYVLAYLQSGTEPPRSVRSAIAWSFEAKHAIASPDHRPGSGSVVVVTMPAAIRQAIGTSLRTTLPLDLHADDRGAALDAFAAAIAAAPAPKKVDVAPKNSYTTAPSGDRTMEARLSALEEQMKTEGLLARSTLLVLEQRVADLEAEIAGRADDAQMTLPTLTESGAGV